MKLKKLGSASAAFALAITLAACSQDEAEQAVDDVESAAVDVKDDASSAIAGDDTEDSGDDTGEAGDDTDDQGEQSSADLGGQTGRDVAGAESARTVALDVLAEAGVADGVVTTQDWDDDGGWEIDVVSGETIHEVKVVDGEVAERENDDADEADTAASSASTSIDDAIATATDSVEGELDEASFEDGTWKIEIDTADEDDVEVLVDAESGELLS